MREKTPIELLRAVIEEQGYDMPCDALHELYGDDERDCRGRHCGECKIDAMNKAADLVEAEIDALKARALPEGMEWPTVDGRKVDFKTGYEPSLGVLEAVSIYSNGACEVMSHDGIVKPVSEIHTVVLAADGEPLKVGQTVWDVESGVKYEVVGIHIDEDSPVRVMRTDGSHLAKAAKPSTLAHQRPVLDADGVPIKKGDTVYVAPFDDPLTVRGFDADGRVLMDYHSDDSFGYSPENLTHTKPEPPDSWERIADEIDRLREDIALHLGDYLYDRDGNDSIQFSMECVAKRCRALAKRDAS